ncbi:TPA: hypothetical protein ACP41M_004785 [Klebsiella aerogenes]
MDTSVIFNTHINININIELTLPLHLGYKMLKVRTERLEPVTVFRP